MNTRINSLQSRLALLIALVVLPGLLLLSWQSWQQSNQAIESAEQQAISIARMLASDQQRLIDKTHLFLKNLSGFAEIQNPDSPYCSQFLKNTLAISSDYVNIGVPRADGQLLCNAKPLTSPVNVADRPYIRQALDGRQFSIGEFQTDRAVGITSINLAYPVIDPVTDDLRGAAVAVISLEWWSNRLANSTLPENTVAFVTDQEESIVAHYPPDPTLLGSKNHHGVYGENDGGPVVQESDEVRMYATRSFLESSGQNPFTITVGVPFQLQLQTIEYKLLRNAVVLVLTTLISFSLALGWMHLSVLQPIRQLMRKSAELEEGKTSAQDIYTGATELIELQKRFDRSATTRLQSEEKLQQSKIKLHESEARFRQMAEAMSDAYWLAEIEDNGSCTFLYVNPAFMDIWQHKRIDLYLDAAVWIASMHPEDRERSSQAFNEFCLGNTDHYEDEFRILTPDGTEKHVHVSGKLIFENNKPSRVTGLARDVTEIRQTETALRRSQKMEAIGQLSGGIAHDFNNILGIIQGNLDLLRYSLVNDKKAENRLNQAYHGAQRAAALTSRLLAFSREGSNTINHISINRFIENMEHLVSRSLTASITVETRLPNHLWSVSIDPGELEDALLNLSINARDAMPEGGTLTITTENCVISEQAVRKNPEASSGKFVKISVTDTGTGINPEIQARIYEPFFTTKEVGKGTGLGLSMVYGFARRCGGYISLHSEQGKGTTFSIFLPRSSPMRVTLPSNNENLPLPRGDATILVVDDEAGLLELATIYLEDLGYKAIATTSAKEALEILSTQPVDLLFSDVIMPGGIDGYQLAEKSFGINPGIKVLLSSGYISDDKKEQAGDSNFPLFLTENLLAKPYTQTELAKSVRDALEFQIDMKEQSSVC